MSTAPCPDGSSTDPDVRKQTVPPPTPRIRPKTLSRIIFERLCIPKLAEKGKSGLASQVSSVSAPEPESSQSLAASSENNIEGSINSEGSAADRVYRVIKSLDNFPAGRIAYMARWTRDLASTSVLPTIRIKMGRTSSDSFVAPYDFNLLVKWAKKIRPPTSGVDWEHLEADAGGTVPTWFIPRDNLYLAPFTWERGAWHQHVKLIMISQIYSELGYSMKHLFSHEKKQEPLTRLAFRGIYLWDSTSVFRRHTEVPYWPEPPKFKKHHDERKIADVLFVVSPLCESAGGEFAFRFQDREAWFDPSRMDYGPWDKNSNSAFTFCLASHVGVDLESHPLYLGRRIGFAYDLMGRGVMAQKYSRGPGRLVEDIESHEAEFYKACTSWLRDIDAGNDVPWPLLYILDYDYLPSKVHPHFQNSPASLLRGSDVNSVIAALKLQKRMDDLPDGEYAREFQTTSRWRLQLNFIAVEPQMDKESDVETRYTIHAILSMDGHVFHDVSLEVRDTNSLREYNMSHSFLFANRNRAPLMGNNYAPQKIRTVSLSLSSCFFNAPALLTRSIVSNAHL